jgi:hypothetical protein
MVFSVALARAVYARTKYVLLDDPLSAVVSITTCLFICHPVLMLRIGQSYFPVLIRETLPWTVDGKPYSGMSAIHNDTTRY